MADETLKNPLINKTNEDDTVEAASSNKENKNVKNKNKYSLKSSDKEVCQSKAFTEDANDPNCPICLEQFENKSYPSVCNHEYCFSCLKKWATTVRNTCPLCNKRFLSIIYNVESPRKFDTYVLEKWDCPITLPTERIVPFGYPSNVTAGSHVDPPERNIRRREIVSGQIMNDMQRSVIAALNSGRRFDQPAPSASIARLLNTQGCIRFGYLSNVTAGSHVDPPERNIRRREIVSGRIMNDMQRSVIAALNNIRRLDQPAPNPSIARILNTQGSFRFGYLSNVTAGSHVDPPERNIPKEIGSGQMTNASQRSVIAAPNNIRRFDEPELSTSTSKILNTERFVRFGYAPNVAAESQVDPPERNLKREIQSDQMMNASQWSVIAAPNKIRRLDEPGPSTSTFTDFSTETSNHALNESSEIERPSSYEDNECQVVQVLNPRCKKIPEAIDLSSGDEI